ncbi:MAG: hypothetical protein RLZZ607_1419, partial [Pseudomonadota bacterium]
KAPTEGQIAQRNQEMLGESQVDVQA